MEAYDAMRHFADSWGLVGMVAVFLIVVLRALVLSRRDVRDAAEIPFKDYSDPEHPLHGREREETR